MKKDTIKEVAGYLLALVGGFAAAAAFIIILVTGEWLGIPL